MFEKRKRQGMERKERKGDKLELGRRKRLRKRTERGSVTNENRKW